MGFTRLVEKDWCAFGHMFALRSKPGSSEYSPVFLQWLDAVFQTQRQYPSKFEWDDNYLPAVVDVFLGGWSNTFVGNCERERNDNRVGGLSLFHVIDTEQCTNQSFTAPTAKVDLLRPNWSLQSIPVWSLYLRQNDLATTTNGE